MVKRVARDDAIRVLVVRSANVPRPLGSGALRGLCRAHLVAQKTYCFFLRSCIHAYIRYYFFFEELYTYNI